MQHEIKTTDEGHGRAHCRGELGRQQCTARLCAEKNAARSLHVANLTARLAVKLAAMRLAIATKETPREAECRRQRERDQELKAAHAARMAAHAAAQESAR